ncbi:hypothetical protein ARMSODRAFT_569711 [Armillaria solidipes]|uniref:Uncharacterized protein n=1 Tax=Armillaria solidipes TaxID=1076256 RepID=A0A2H3BYI4_9AGAR|nr:hypothetical protein ARMSODRAFT_569711 [Armillaria solidipes]
MSSSPAATPPIKSEGVKTFGTVPATVSQVNGKSSVSIAKPGSSSSTPHKPRKQDIAKLFSNPSSAPPSQASSDTSSPNIRPSNLPPSSQPPSMPSSSHPPYPSFVPQNGMRPQQPNAGPNGGATGSGPRSPQYQHQRQVPNGNAPRIPSGPGGPGAPQMSAGLGSPRTGRLNISASAFVPGQRSSARVSLKNAEGKEINLDTLKNQKLSPALSGAALPPVVSPAHGSPNRRSVIRMESEEERSKRLAGEREKELAKAKAEADSKAKKEKEENQRREELKRDD